MTDVIDVPAHSAEQLASLKQLTLITYVLYALSHFSGGLTALVAIIINYVKLGDAAGTLYESHFRWQMRTFWWGLLWATLGFITIFIVIGFGILFANFVWTLYRIVKGFLNWNDNKPMPL
jgi:uncharacterized membrane protein